MTLKLAASDYTFPKLEWEQALRLAADLGVEAGDIGLFADRRNLCLPVSFRRRLSTSRNR